MATPELVEASQEAPPSAITFALRDAFLDICGERQGWLNRYTVEREHHNFMMGLCMIAGVDYMLLGPPGVGKTYAIELLVDHCVVDASIFTHLLAKDQSANEILGSPDVNALKEGRIRRITEGMLPESNFGYLDEFFKASPPTLNPLLDIMGTRKLKVGGAVTKLDRLISIAMSSNELPTGREDLTAIRDRVDVTMEVKNVETPQGWRRVIDVQCEIEEHGLDTSTLHPVTVDQWFEMRQESRAITLPDMLRATLVDALGKFQKADHLPSMRRLDRMRRLAKAHAWAFARTEVSADDLMPIQHMAWNDLDHAKSARDIVSEYLGAFTQIVQEVRDKLEPIMVQMNDLQAKVAAAGNDKQRITELMQGGTSFIADLRGIREETEQLVAKGKAENQDVSALEEVLAEITKATTWTMEALKTAFGGGA